MVEPVRKRDLSPREKELLEMMQRVNHGVVEQVSVRMGELQAPPPKHVIRTVKLGANNQPRAELQAGDFVLKAEVREFLAQVRRLKDATIDVEVKYGLPFLMRIRETV